MAVVRAIMMQRDEGDVLLRWITHYANLFGFANLSILDNGSRDPHTINILKWVEHAGATIYWHLTTRHDFHNKGGHIGNIIHHWDAEYAYDFALPVDCDETLAVFTQDGLTTDASAIHAEFDRLREVRSALRIDMSLFNVPGRAGWYAPVRHFHKGFLCAHSIGEVDKGYHDPKSRLLPGFETTRFTYLHWHNPSFEAYRASARRKLQGIVDATDIRALRAHERKPGAEGVHLVQALLMSEREYLSRYDREMRVFVGEGSDVNYLALPGGTSRLWNAQAYLDLHPDVADYALTPLHHYIRWGFKEGRAPGETLPA